MEFEDHDGCCSWVHTALSHDQPCIVFVNLMRLAAKLYFLITASKGVVSSMFFIVDIWLSAWSSSPKMRTLRFFSKKTTGFCALQVMCVAAGKWSLDPHALPLLE